MTPFCLIWSSNVVAGAVDGDGVAEVEAAGAGLALAGDPGVTLGELAELLHPAEANVTAIKTAAARRVNMKSAPL